MIVNAGGSISLIYAYSTLTSAKILITEPTDVKKIIKYYGWNDNQNINYKHNTTNQNIE